MPRPAEVGRRVRHDARGDRKHTKYSQNGREMFPCGSLFLVPSFLVPSFLVARHSANPPFDPEWVLIGGRSYMLIVELIRLNEKVPWH